VLEVIESSDAEVVILRFPATWVAWPAALTRSSRQCFHADALLYWAGVPAGGAADDGAAGTRAARRADELIVAELVRSTFLDYSSHYAANPSLAPHDIANGYVEWACSFLDAPARMVLLVDDERSQEPAAFAAVELAEGHGEICLAGVAPSARERGIYRRLLTAAEIALASKGRSKVVISTQVHNIAAQRAWAARGYRPIAAFETVHLVASR